MADDQQQRLLWQQDETMYPPHTVTSPARQEQPAPDMEMQGEIKSQETEPQATLDLTPVAKRETEFEQRLQHMAETLRPRRGGVWSAAEPLGWVIALFSLFWGDWPLSMVCTLLAVLAGNYKRLEKRYMQSQAALDLAQYSAEWLGPLALALESPQYAVRPAAAQMLLRVLPLVTSSDFASLDAFQRGCLYRCLGPNEMIEPVLSLAVLEMIEQAGDAEAIPYVERLSHGEAPTAERRRLCATAQAVLPRLSQRLQREAEAAQHPNAAAVGEAEQAAAVTPQTRWAITQVEAQLKLLEQERKKHTQPGMRIGFLLASWLVIVPYTAFQVWANMSQENWLVAAVWSLLTVFATQLHRYCLSSRQSEAARKLAMHDDVRGVGPLAEALEWPDPDIQVVAARALTRLLPRLQATDAGLLNTAQRASLYRRLHPSLLNQTNQHAEFQIAILKALEQVGDEAAVPYVKKLAHGAGLGFRQKQVREAARECLPALTQRAAELKVSQTLLRASSSSATTPDMLLRPADSAPLSTPEQLLRATTGES